MSESETSESAEKDSIIDRMTKLFGDEVAQQFQGKLKKKLVETLTSFSSPVWNWALSYFWWPTTSDLFSSNVRLFTSTSQTSVVTCLFKNRFYRKTLSLCFEDNLKCPKNSHWNIACLFWYLKSNLQGIPSSKLHWTVCETPRTALFPHSTSFSFLRHGLYMVVIFLYIIMTLFKEKSII